MNKSTVYREINRNRSEKHHRYHWIKAQEYTKDRRELLKRSRIIGSEFALHERIAKALILTRLAMLI